MPACATMDAQTHKPHRKSKDKKSKGKSSGGESSVPRIVLIFSPFLGIKTAPPLTTHYPQSATPRPLPFRTPESFIA
jgi:hypothetical protein